MRKPLGYILSWVLYGLGHIVSRPMLWWDWPVYPVFNWLMLRSSDVQDWAGAGPWSEVKE